MPRRLLEPKHEPPPGSEWVQVEAGRKKLGLSLSAFSKHCGFSQSAYGKISSKPEWDGNMGTIRRFKAKLAEDGVWTPMAPGDARQRLTVDQETAVELMVRNRRSLRDAERAARAAAVFEPLAKPERLVELGERLLGATADFSYRQDGVVMGSDRPTGLLEKATVAFPKRLGDGGGVRHGAAHKRPRASKNAR